MHNNISFCFYRTALTPFSAATKAARLGAMPALMPLLETVPPWLCLRLRLRLRLASRLHLQVVVAAALQPTVIPLRLRLLQPQSSVPRLQVKFHPAVVAASSVPRLQLKFPRTVVAASSVPRLQLQLLPIRVSDLVLVVHVALISGGANFAAA